MQLDNYRRGSFKLERIKWQGYGSNKFANAAALTSACARVDFPLPCEAHPRRVALDQQLNKESQEYNNLSENDFELCPQEQDQCYIY